ncbi:MAG: type II restriction endonuclease [Anaerolineaceae bacterium]|nr:type II restriction endonuclease [Anaerolineaceae bacterium]MDE0327854.1 type II restriction endonuclease [Anaerolineaceae bacterium]
MAEINDLRDFAKQQGVELAKPKDLVSELIDNLTARYGYSSAEIKANFDQILNEAEQEAHTLYRKHEQEYCKRVLGLYISHLVKEGGIKDPNDVGVELGANVSLLDKFFLSLAQGRKARAGGAFETFHNDLFRGLGYPFSEQALINGKPDFLLPSAGHYQKNASDCIIFTVKRTVRERWRLVVTEGTRGLAYFLATIDKDLSRNQLEEMLANRVHLVCPHDIKQQQSAYRSAPNVLSFQDFFQDYLDPAMDRWKRNGVI